MKIQGKGIHEIFSTLSLGWHNLFTCHISKKNNMYRHKPQGNIGMKKQHCVIKQVKSNVQSFIEQCLDIMLHEMKRSGHG